MASTHWTIRHFSQANPDGPRKGDVPALLRRIADSIEQLDGAEVQDITYSLEVTAEGIWPMMTVYFHLPEDGEDRS